MTDRSRPDDDVTEFTYEEDRDSTVDSSTHPDPDADDRPDPLGELAATVEKSDRSRSSTPDFDELFDRQETTAIDSDRLWARLEADGSTDVPLPADRETREVEKRSYCQGCDHFADPPDVACTREGTEIHTVPTMTTFRVVDCPFVLEDEALEGDD